MCLTGKNCSRFRHRGSVGMNASCRCGGTGCARSQARNLLRSTPRGSSPTIAAAPLPSGTTRMLMPPFWWHPRHPLNGRSSVSGFSMLRLEVASRASTRLRTNGTHGNPGHRPPSRKLLRRPWQRRPVSSKWRWTSYKQKNEPRTRKIRCGVLCAPPTGLEPVTLRLTVECSAN